MLYMYMFVQIFFKMKISNITLISCYYELKAYTGIYTKSSVNLVFQKGFDVFILNYSCKILFMRKKNKKFWKYRYVGYVISVSLCLHLLFYICMWYEKRRENNTLSLIRIQGLPWHIAIDIRNNYTGIL